MEGSVKNVFLKKIFEFLSKTFFSDAALSGFIGKINYNPSIETPNGFITNCQPFCCAYLQNGNSLTPTNSTITTFCTLDEIYEPICDDVCSTTTLHDCENYMGFSHGLLSEDNLESVALRKGFKKLVNKIILNKKN